MSKPKPKKHLNIEEKREIITFKSENALMSNRKLADHFSAKLSRPLSHTTIQSLLEKSSDILSTPKKACNDKDDFFCACGHLLRFRISPS